MSFFRQRDNASIDRRQSLAGVPVLNTGVTLDRTDGGNAYLQAVRTRGARGWMDRFRPRVDERRYELDEFGTFVVGMMDGHRTVLEIVDRFQASFGMSRRESELGVVAFIKSLMQRSLLSVGLRDSRQETAS